MDAKNYDVAVAGESMAAKLLEPYDGGMAGERGKLTTCAPQGMGMKAVKYAAWKLMTARLHLEDTES